MRPRRSRRRPGRSAPQNGHELLLQEELTREDTTGWVTRPRNLRNALLAPGETYHLEFRPHLTTRDAVQLMLAAGPAGEAHGTVVNSPDARRLLRIDALRPADHPRPVRTPMLCERGAAKSCEAS